MLMELG